MKCIFCDEEINEEVDSYFITNEGDYSCEACYEEGFDSASKLYIFEPDNTEEVEPVYFDNYFIYSGDDTGPVLKQKWVATDGWRGYTDWEIDSDYETIADGWVTSWLDDTTSYKMTGAKLFEKLVRGEISPPITIHWLFGTTSNVFSTASEIIVAKDDIDEFKQWLISIGFDSKELERSFN